MLHTSRGRVASFKKKIKLYLTSVQDGDITMFSKMRTFLETLANTKSYFHGEIISNLTSVCEAIVNYFPKLDKRFHGICTFRPLSVQECAIDEEDFAAKVEFLQIRKDSQLKVGFVKQELGTFWFILQKDYSILSRRALKFLIQSPSTCC